MKIYRQLFVTACLVVSLACYSVKAQGCPARIGACVALTEENFEPQLIALLVASVGDQTPVVTVGIPNFRVVCETSGIVRGEARQVTVLTNFSCSSDIAAACPPTPEAGVVYSARCTFSEGSFIWDFGTQRNDNLNGTLFSAPVSYCGGCRFNQGSDPDTLCLSQCSSNADRNCTEGLQRCTGLGADTGSCCNFYYDDNGDPSDDVCCSECPVGFVPDENFDCGCPNLAAPTNGAVIYSDGDSILAYSVLSIATFTCNSGYTIVNDTTRTCQPGTAWDGDSNTACVEVMCPILSDPENGQVTVNGRTVGENATYSCDDTFYLNREETRTCQNSGQWSEEEPTCDLEVMCPVLSGPENGQVTVNGRTVGVNAMYSCDDNFYLNGEETRTCQNGGQWSDEEPTCVCTSESAVELSIGGAVAITAVVCSVVFLLIGAVLGGLVVYCITAKRAQYSVSSSSTEPQTPAPVYEEITATDTHPKAIELSENIAYGPARQ